ncbi:MAG TPA: hypothetical protein VIG99_32685 [Myxococcaceae bacterium]|jgi:hypothetical protein
MNLRSALVAASLAAVALLTSCGLFGGETFTLSSGTYKVSSATLASANDQCGLLGAYTDPAKVIGITVSGSTVTFNLANDSAAAANTLPTATINENAIETPVEANYTVAFGSTCVTRIHRNVIGDITANDEGALTLAFSVATESGNCSSGTSFSAVPCSSSYHFLVKKE